ncbi:MAG: hypothetical protein M0D55_01620 [Elusimicrobiota bacterium]|nr:MAG: hypothetical protein M0D55_01620 [Elusimicrobiota bacterium]
MEPATCWTRNWTSRTVFGAVADAVPAISALGVVKATRVPAPGTVIATEGCVASNVKFIGAAGTSMLPVGEPTALSSENTASE